MKGLALLLSLLSLFAAVSCAPARSGQEDVAPLKEGPKQLELPALNSRVPRSSTRRTSLEDLPIPKWPESWHLADRGRFGTADLPVVWFKLDAGQTPVVEAAQVAVAAIQKVAGRIELEDSAHLDDPERAIAQLRGSRVNAAIEASTSQTRTLVKITLEAKPGFGRKATDTTP